MSPEDIPLPQVPEVPPEVQSAEDFARDLISLGIDYSVASEQDRGKISNNARELMQKRDAAIRAAERALDKQVALKILQEYWPMGNKALYERAYERICKEVTGGN